MPKVTPFRRSFKRRGKIKKTKTYSLRYRDPISGQDVVESTGVRRKDAADELARAKEKELERIAAGIFDETKELLTASYEEAEEAYLTHSQVIHREGTYRNYRRTLRYFREIVKPRNIRAITASQIDAFIAGLKKTKGMNAVSINKHLRQLHAFLAWGEERGYTEKIPKMSRLKETKSPPVVIHKDDQRKLLDAIADPECDIRFYSQDWWTVWTKLLFYSGMRKGEMLRLCWSDVDFRDRSMLVKGDEEKTHRYRMLPLNRKVRALLKWWWFVLDRPALAKPVFPLRSHKRQVYGDWMRIREHAGVGNVSFKNARSTAGTEITAEVGLEGAQFWLGHSTPAITAAYYANQSPTLRKVAAGRQSIE